MADNLFNGLVTVATAIVGIAILAVLVSKNSQTPAVIGSAGSALATAIQAATGPVTGGVGGNTLGAMNFNPISYNPGGPSTYM